MGHRGVYLRRINRSCTLHLPFPRTSVLGEVSDGNNNATVGRLQDVYVPAAVYSSLLVFVVFVSNA